MFASCHSVNSMAFEVISSISSGQAFASSGCLRADRATAGRGQRTAAQGLYPQGPLQVGNLRRVARRPTDAFVALKTE